VPSSFELVSNFGIRASDFQISRILRRISSERDYAFSQTALGKEGSPAANSRLVK
jgi:hypothetical protein